jgi:hypothetical protein
MFLINEENFLFLGYAEALGNLTKTCKELGIARSSFYERKKAYDKEGKAGLLRNKPVAKSHPKKLKSSVIEKIIDLRITYQLSSLRIQYYLETTMGSSYLSPA